MSKKFKKIYSIITTIPIVIVVVFAFLLVGVRLIGLEPYTVLSGSMEPEYHVGSLIYVKKVDPATLNIGDPVTYVVQGNTVVTHRIIDKSYNADKPGTIYFQTQGDANNTPDGAPVASQNVIGKPVFTIPLLGYVSNFIQNPPGTYVAICGCLLLLLLTFAPDFINAGKDKDEKAESEKALDASVKETVSAEDSNTTDVQSDSIEAEKQTDTENKD